MRSLVRPLPLLLALALLAVPAARAEEPSTEPAAAKAPAFTLKDIHGNDRSLADFAGKWVVLEWVNLGCPFVKKHYHPSHRHMQKLQQTYTGKDVVWLSICSSAPGKQGHMTPEAWRQAVRDQGVHSTAVLLDEDGTVGHAYGARTTPEIRIIDPQGRIGYAGAIDDRRSANPADVPPATNYVVQFLTAALAGEEPPTRRTQSYGCSVKYAQ